MTEKRTIADCIIVAAGSGKRLGAKMPKAFVNLGDRPLFVHSLLVFARHRAIDKIILVVPAAMTDRARKIVSTLRVKKEIIIVKGGLHRWLSVKSGVDVSKAEWVMIHDSARPFLTKRIINAVLSVSGKYDAVIAATPEVDTIRELKNPAVPRDEESSIPMEKKHTHSRSPTPKQASRNALAMGFTGDCAGNTLDRNGLVRVQTPQIVQALGTNGRVQTRGPASLAAH